MWHAQPVTVAPTVAATAPTCAAKPTQEASGQTVEGQLTCTAGHAGWVASHRQTASTGGQGGAEADTLRSRRSWVPACEEPLANSRSRAG